MALSLCPLCKRNKDITLAEEKKKNLPDFGLISCLGKLHTQRPWALPTNKTECTETLCNVTLPPSYAQFILIAIMGCQRVTHKIHIYVCMYAPTYHTLENQVRVNLLLIAQCFFIIQLLYFSNWLVR